MREAVTDGVVLGSPSVGTWRPAIGLGAPLSPGLVLGWLQRAGSALEVVAPASASGVAVEVVRAGAWVAYGAPLVTCGEGGLGEHLAPASAAVITGGPEGAVAVRVDTDGTVFLSPEPGAAPYAAVGGRVEALATVALVEVMKTFTPVRAPIAGTIARVDVAPGAAITAGAAIVWILPG